MFKKIKISLFSDGSSPLCSEPHELAFSSSFQSEQLSFLPSEVIQRLIHHSEDINVHKL